VEECGGGGLKREERTSKEELYTSKKGWGLKFCQGGKKEKPSTKEVSKGGDNQAKKEEESEKTEGEVVGPNVKETRTAVLQNESAKKEKKPRRRNITKGGTDISRSQGQGSVT